MVNGVVEGGITVVDVKKSVVNIVVVETGGIVNTFLDINGIDVVVVNGAFPVI